MDLTALQKRKLVQGYKTMKLLASPWTRGVSYYDQFVLWHRTALAWENGMAHMGPAFLPWHRQFLLLFEQGMQQAIGDSSFGLPYWDWSDPSATSVIFANDLMGGSGDPSQNFQVTSGPFTADQWRLNVIPQKLVDKARFRALHRNFGSSILAPVLPIPADIIAGFAIPTYDVVPFDVGSDVTLSFRNYMEGFKNYVGMDCDDAGQMTAVPGPGNRIVMHSQVHVFVGGFWGDPGVIPIPSPWGPVGASYQGSMVPNTSPNDPTFFIHHCNVDRVWWEWQQINGVMNYQPLTGANHGHNLNDKMWPYCDPKLALNTTPADMLDITPLGYTYG